MCICMCVVVLQASAGVGAQRSVLAAAWLPALTQQQQVTLLLGPCSCGVAATLRHCHASCVMRHGAVCSNAVLQLSPSHWHYGNLRLSAVMLSCSAAAAVTLSSLGLCAVILSQQGAGWEVPIASTVLAWGSN